MKGVIEEAANSITNGQILKIFCQLNRWQIVYNLRVQITVTLSQAQSSNNNNNKYL